MTEIRFFTLALIFPIIAFAGQDGNPSGLSAISSEASDTSREVDDAAPAYKSQDKNVPDLDAIPTTGRFDPDGGYSKQKPSAVTCDLSPSGATRIGESDFSITAFYPDGRFKLIPRSNGRLEKMAKLRDSLIATGKCKLPRLKPCSTQTSPDNYIRVFGGRGEAGFFADYNSANAFIQRLVKSRLCSTPK